MGSLCAKVDENDTGAPGTQNRGGVPRTTMSTTGNDYSMQSYLLDSETAQVMKKQRGLSVA